MNAALTYHQRSAFLVCGDDYRSPRLVEMQTTYCSTVETFTSTILTPET